MNNTFLDVTVFLVTIYSPFPFSAKLLTVFVYLQHSTQKMLWKSKIHHMTLPVVSQLTQSKSLSPYNVLKGSTSSVPTHNPDLTFYHSMPTESPVATLASHCCHLGPVPSHSRSPVHMAPTMYMIHSSLLLNNFLASSSHKDFLHLAYLKWKFP